MAVEDEHVDGGGGVWVSLSLSVFVGFMGVGFLSLFVFVGFTGVWVFL